MPSLEFTYDSSAEPWTDAALIAAKDPDSGVQLVLMSEETLDLHGQPVLRRHRRVCDMEGNALEEAECHRLLRPYLAATTQEDRWAPVDWLRSLKPVNVPKLLSMLKPKLLGATPVERLQFGGGKL